MSGFTFPPPPPPPPPSSAPSPGHQPHGHRGGFNGRGSRGRGRGNHRGGYGRGGPHQQNGSYVARPSSIASPPSQGWQAGPNAHNLAGTFSGQPFTHQGSSNSVQYLQQPTGYSQSAFPNVNSNSGFKRTLNQAFNHGSQTPPQPKPESKPKIAPPPSVPSFGFSLAPAIVPAKDVNAVSETASAKKKQRKHNVLGLTPKGEVYEDSEDDVDEEALFAQSSQSGMVTYRGRSIQLNTAADVAAWIAERKKNFPTAARIAVRKAAQEEARAKARDAREAEKKRRQEERATALEAKKQGKRSKKGKPKAIKGEDSDLQTAVKSEPNSDDPLARIAQLEEQLRQAKEALAGGTKSAPPSEVKTEPKADETAVEIKVDPESIVSNELPMLPSTEANGVGLMQPRVSQSLGLDYSSDVDDDDHDLSEVSSEDPSSESSDSASDEESDSDAPPEEESTSHGPVNLPPPPRDGPNKTQTCYAFANTGKCKYGDKCMRSHDVPCRFYAKHGHCRYGDKCRMSHDVTPGTGKKGATISTQRPKTMSLRERMIDKELKEEAVLGLHVIKQLGANGFFSGG